MSDDPVSPKSVSGVDDDFRTAEKIYSSTAAVTNLVNGFAPLSNFDYSSSSSSADAWCTYPHQPKSVSDVDYAQTAVRISTAAAVVLNSVSRSPK